MVEKLRVGVLASGGGTDLQSIIDASEKGMIDAEVVVVISDKKDAFSLKRAKKHNIKTYFVDPKEKNRIDHEKDQYCSYGECCRTCCWRRVYACSFIIVCKKMVWQTYQYPSSVASFI